MPAQTQHRPKHNRNSRRDLKPSRLSISQRRHNNPPRIQRQALPLTILRRQVPNLPQPIHSREHQPHRRSIDPPQRTHNGGFRPQKPPQRLHARSQDDAGDKDANEAEECADEGGDVTTVLQRKGAEVDAEVEVGAGEGLDDGEAEEEVSGGDPRVLGGGVRVPRAVRMMMKVVKNRAMMLRPHFMGMAWKLVSVDGWGVRDREVFIP
jgi:hypothetical protein